MSKIFMKENEQLLGYYAGVGEEVSLSFDEQKNEFYVEYYTAPSGGGEIFRGKDSILANVAFYKKFKESLQTVIEENQKNRRVITSCKVTCIPERKEGEKVKSIKEQL